MSLVAFIGKSVVVGTLAAVRTGPLLVHGAMWQEVGLKFLTQDTRTRGSYHSMLTRGRAIKSRGRKLKLRSAIVAFHFVVVRLCMWFLILLLFLAHVAGDSAFRFGAVLSTVGARKELAEAKNGFELYFDAINAQNDGRGFVLGGKNGTKAFLFKFEFVSREDRSNATTHERHVKDLVDKEKVHFLGGSHPTFAESEMRIANDAGILNYHCCVGPDHLYEQDHPTVYGIQASNKEYTRMLIRTLQLRDVSSIAFVYQEDNSFTRTTCEAAERFFDELDSVRMMDPRNKIHHPFNETLTQTDIEEIAEAAKQNEIEAMIACVFPDEGKRLVEAFHKLRCPLRAFFLTTGPTKQEWVDEFDPPYLANDLFSAGQWHRSLNYTDDFFGSTENYGKMYQEKFDGLHATYVAAGASAVGLTLTKAIQDAFRDCDISATRGDVDALLRDPDAIECDGDGSNTGYQRVLDALAALKMEETFFGGVEFNQHRQNVGLDPVTTQVFEREEDGKTYREIAAVLPIGHATELLKYPMKNRYRKKCTPGYFIDPDRFDPCMQCEPGEFSDKEEADHCDNCPIGTWTNKPAQRECMPCPEGTNTTIRGATKKTDCECKPGYFNIAREKGEKCVPCPDGAYCEGGMQPPIPREGYWADDSRPNKVHSCDPPSSCLGGEDSKCEAGRTGRLCSECDDGYFQAFEKCYPCRCRAVIITLFVLLLLVWYVINVIVSRSVASLEIILHWAQLANIIGDIRLNWTNIVTALFGMVNLLDFDVDIMEPTCLFKWGLRENFVLQLALPVLMTIMSCSGYLGSVLAYVMLKHKWIRLDGKRRRLLSIFVHVPENNEQLMEKWDATIARFLASVDITYVTTAKYCFDVFKCENIAGVSVLRVDPSVVCDEEHTVMMILAALGILFYVVGYPAFIFWKLRNMHSNGSFVDSVQLRRYGFIYEKYELDHYYTDMVVVVRKLLFVLVLVYIQNPAFQVGSIAIIINASLMLHVYTAPYVDTYLDILFSFLLIALMFEAFGGLMFYSENLPENRQILESIVLISFLMLVVVFVLIFAAEIMNKYHTLSLKRQHRRFARGNKHDDNDAEIALPVMNHPIARAVLDTVGTREVDKTISFELLDTFNSGFIHRCFQKNPRHIQDWDKLASMLKDYMADDSETSYLSTTPVAKFWRRLVNQFPELVDFLAVADEDSRNKFDDFATNLYRNFYLSKKIEPLPLIRVLNWRDHAPLAQWLAIATTEERQFFVNFVTELYKTAGKKEAATALSSKLETGGPDPHLQGRVDALHLNRRKRQALGHITSSSHPFHHSAAERRLNTFTTVAVTVTKLRLARLRSKKRLSQALTPAGLCSSSSSSQAAQGPVSEVDREAYSTGDDSTSRTNSCYDSSIRSPSPDLESGLHHSVYTPRKKISLSSLCNTV